MLLRLLTIGIILLSCAPCDAQEPDSNSNAQLKQWLRKFPKSDINRDGILTRSEAAAFRKAKGWGKKNASKRTAPTLANVKYGIHERNVFDLWMPDQDKDESAKKLPILIYVHGSFPKLFGVRVDQFASRPKVQKMVEEASPMAHVSSDDPPTLLVYGGKNENIPLPSTASASQLIHHAYFGFVMKQKLDECGVANQFLPGVNSRDPAGTKKIVEWLRQNLQNSNH